MARIYKRKNSTLYQCEYRIPGNPKPVRESTETADPAKAKLFLEGRIRETGYTKAVGPATQRVKFGDLAKLIRNDYIAQGQRSRNLEHTLMHLKANFGTYRACDISAMAISDYAADRIAAGASNASANRELATLRRMFKLGIKHGIVGQAPYIQLLPEGNSRTAYFELAEFMQVRDAMPADMRDFVAALFYTGVRRTQMAMLEWRDVFGDRVVMRGETTKNGEVHIIPLAGEFGEAIARARETRRLDCRFVFHRAGKPFCYADGSLEQDFREAWEKALGATGFAGRRLHDFRRSAATHLAKSGVPEQVAMKITGHKTAGMYRRYNIIDQDAVAAAMRQQRDYLAQTSTQSRVTKARPE